MRLTPEKRGLIGEAIDRGVNKSWVAKVLGTARNTVYKWDKRRKHLRDRKRKKKKSKRRRQEKEQKKKKALVKKMKKRKKIKKVLTKLYISSCRVSLLNNRCFART